MQTCTWQNQFHYQKERKEGRKNERTGKKRSEEKGRKDERREERMRGKERREEKKRVERMRGEKREWKERPNRPELSSNYRRFKEPHKPIFVNQNQRRRRRRKKWGF